RAQQTFAAGFIPNSINIGIDGTFAPWVGALIPDINQAILVVADQGREKEVVTRLARVGYDNTIGFLDGGFEAWKKSGKEIDTIQSIGGRELAAIMRKNADTKVLDVRKASEYNAEHIDGVENIPLDFINENMPSINKDEPYYVHCASGYRSMIFISILKARGYDNLVDVEAGFKEIKECGLFAITDYVAPTSLL